MTAPAKRVTISFTVPSTLHLIVGLLLAASTIAAYAMHLALPPTDHYRETFAYIGNFAGFVTVGYCIWCATRAANSDTADLAEITETAIEAAADRQAGIQATLEAATTAILLALREIAENLAEDHGTIKRLDEAITSAAEAVEALQDCYLAEGQALVLPAQRDGTPHKAT
jgi:hypothetical protein